MPLRPYQIEGGDNSFLIKRVNYRIIDDHQMSSTGKLAIINKYGSDSWATEEDIQNGTMPSNMDWYINEGVKPVKRGEAALVKFIRALRNFKNIDKKSTQEEKDKYVSLFREEDLNKLFTGNFSDIKKLIMSNSELKVGFLVGVRQGDTGKLYQDFYKDMPLRPYQIEGGDNSFFIIQI